MSNKIANVSEQKNSAKKTGCGCLGIVLIGFFILLIVGFIGGCIGPCAHIKDGVATFEKSFVSGQSLNGAGVLVASDIYNLAKKHSKIKKIVVSVTLNPIGLTDKYGKKPDHFLPMGSITVEDIDEVRRYDNEGAYVAQYGDSFASQIGAMDHAENLGR